MYWPPRKSLKEVGVASANGKKKIPDIKNIG